MNQINNMQRNPNDLQNLSNSINYKKYLIYLLSNWYWLLLSVVIAVGAIYLMNQTSQKKYRVETSLIFRENSNSGGSSGEGTIASINLMDNQLNIQDDITRMQSSKIIRSTLEKLDFNIAYFKEGRFYDQELYKSAPFRVDTDDDYRRFGFPVHIELLSDSRYKVIIDEDFYAEYTLQYGQQFSKHGLSFRLYKNPEYTGSMNKDGRYYFVKHRTKTLTNAYQGKLTITPERENKQVVKLSLTGRVPEKEADFLNALIDTYQEYKLTQITANANSSIQFINQQIEMIDDRLVRYENQLQRMRRQNSSLGQGSLGENAQSGSSSSTNQLSRLENRKLKLQEDKEYFSSLEKKIKANRSIDSIFLPRSIEEEVPRISQLLDEMSTIQQEINTLSDNVESSHPHYKELQSRYEEQKESLATRLSLYIDNLDKTLEKINERISGLEQKMPSLPAKERRYREIQRRIEQNEDLLASLSQKKMEFEIRKSSKTANFEVLEPARPEDAASPQSNSKMYYVMALFMGLAFPVSILLIRKSNFSKIQEKEEIQNYTSIPILHALGQNRFNTNLPTYHYPQSPIADSFRYIRTNLLFHLRSYYHKIVTISSMVSGEGKSFVTANLGTILAMGGFKTVIVSADIRKPTLQKIFSIHNKEGLSEYLLNNFNHENLIHPTSVDNLYLMPPGKNVSNSGDLFAPNKIETLLDYLSTRFEFILFDSPPISMVPESIIIGERSYCNIFVLRHNYTPKNIIQSLNEINQEGRLKNMFLLINAIKKMKGVGFEYYFGYESSYGFGHYDRYYTKSPKKGNLPEHMKRK